MSPELRKLKAAYRRWDRSKGADTSMWLELFADEIDFRSLANGRKQVAFTVTRTRPADVKAYLDGLTAAFEMLHYTTKDFIQDGSRIVVYGTTSWINRATGKRFETPIMTLWRFKRGKAIAFHEFFDTAAVLETTRAQGGGARRIT